MCFECIDHFYFYNILQVVECNSSSDDQLKALKVLLHFIQSDSKLYSEFITLDGYKLLAKALTSSQIHSNCSLLMVSKNILVNISSSK